MAAKLKHAAHKAQQRGGVSAARPVLCQKMIVCVTLTPETIIAMLL